MEKLQKKQQEKCNVATTCCFTERQPAKVFYENSFDLHQQHVWMKRMYLLRYWK